MSVTSSSTAATPDRGSMQSHWRTTLDEQIPELPSTRLVRDDVGDEQQVESVDEKFSTVGLEHRAAMRAN